MWSQNSMDARGDRRDSRHGESDCPRGVFDRVCCVTSQLFNVVHHFDLGGLADARDMRKALSSFIARSLASRSSMHRSTRAWIIS